MNSFLALVIILLNSLPPGLPCSWAGTVNVPEGTPLEAWGEHGPYATTMTFSYTGVGVVYRINVPADDPSAPEREGAVEGEGIAFYLVSFGWADEIGWWAGGTSSELNLHAEGGAPVTPTPSATVSLRLVIGAPNWPGGGQRGRMEICAEYGDERVCVTVWIPYPPWPME